MIVIIKNLLELLTQKKPQYNSKEILKHNKKIQKKPPQKSNKTPMWTTKY